MKKRILGSLGLIFVGSVWACLARIGIGSWLEVGACFLGLIGVILMCAATAYFINLIGESFE